MAKIVLTLLLVLGLGQMAFADAQLRLSSGATTITVVDGGAGDANALAGVITFIGGVAGWTINVSTGLSPDPSFGVPSLDLNSVDTQTAGAAGLTILFSDHSFVTPTPAWEMTLGGTITGTGTITYDAFQAASNAHFDTAAGGLIGSLGPFGAPAFSAAASFGAPTAVTPYSLTQRIIIGGSGVITYSGDAGLHPIPEPGSLFLLGSGLIGFAGFARRKLGKKKS